VAETNTTKPDAMIVGLKGLVNFDGREDRGQFWAYTLTVAIVVGTIATVIAAIFMFRAFDGITFSQAGDFLIEIRDIFMQIRLWTVIALVVLLAAAVTRRLHDVGKSGWGALLPAGFAIAATAALGQLFADLDADDIGDAPLVDTPIEALDDVVSQVDDLFGASGVEIPRIPRVWDASPLELAFVATLVGLAVVTAIPVLMQLLRRSAPEENRYGPAPLDPL